MRTLVYNPVKEMIRMSNAIADSSRGNLIPLSRNLPASIQEQTSLKKTAK
ncbi:MAG: hypothetical protein IPN18_06100 [Ignavibacteriales bacterium]|nr:hypothetical protein [Ignavibacteriales bacterium]